MRRELQRTLYLAVLAAAVALTGCSKDGNSTPDMDPIGDGLTFVGVCFVVGVLALVIGISRFK